MTQTDPSDYGRRWLLRLGVGLWGTGALSVSRAAEAGERRAPQPSIEEDVLRTSNEWFDALRRTDIPAIERLETDDFLTVQESAVGVAIIEKAIQIASLREAKTPPPPLFRELSKIRVRRYGETAVLTAVAIFRRDGGPTSAPASQAVIAEIWVRGADQWRIAHFQTTSVHPKPPR